MSETARPSEREREWRYLSTGSVSHAFSSAAGPGQQSYMSALCGTGPAWYGGAWYGTGSQLEYEECARRRKCKKCVGLLDRNRLLATVGRAMREEDT